MNRKMSAQPTASTLMTQKMNNDTTKREGEMNL